MRGARRTKVAIMGGTGSLGKGLALQLSKKHEVLIGSRVRAKAEAAAKTIPGAHGGESSVVAEHCDIAILAFPFSAIEMLGPLSGCLGGKLVVSTINPIKLEQGLMQYALDKGSATETIAAMLPQSRVVLAFNTIPASFHRRPWEKTADVPVVAETVEVYDETASLVKSIKGLRPLYAGPLAQARMIEEITPLLLNIAKLNGLRNVSVRFISEEKPSPSKGE